MRAVLFAMMLGVATIAAGQTYEDPKHCGFVPRTATGEIKRSSTELKRFQSVHPCPSTGERTGLCPGWAIDHVLPLACGGCDKIVNMQWLPVQAKSCGEPYCKDRFERKIQYVDPATPGLAVFSCAPKLLTTSFFEPIPADEVTP